MSLESISAVKAEDQDSMDVKVAPETAEAQYATIARALAEAQQALSVARAVPQIPMIPVEAAEKQANELKAELVTLTESLEHERSRANDLQAAVDTAVKEKDLAAQARDAVEKRTSELKAEIVTLKETLSRERNCTFALQTAADKESASLVARIELLEASVVREQETRKQELQSFTKARQTLLNTLSTTRSTCVAENANTQRAILELHTAMGHRTTTMKNLDRMIQLLQPNASLAVVQTTTPVPTGSQPQTSDPRLQMRPNVSPVVAQPTTAVGSKLPPSDPTPAPITSSPRRPQGNPVPLKRARMEGDLSPTSTNEPDASVTKRPRTESNYGQIPKISAFEIGSVSTSPFTAPPPDISCKASASAFISSEWISRAASARSSF
ncbi:hypothetical protein MVEN_01828200 [Mycena venus]|uniref:Uncharacterized protein n=1 Tax=Mycena venus TaxID=2733690 RepID=A0A8H6XJX0_9AGAR|nr:hypothetical protein MVEN_01828200 [Mycena venus]